MIEQDERDVRAALPAHAIEVGTEPPAGPARNSVGGWPFLDEGQEWPECFCGERMALFFQLDIPLGLEPFGGDHLLVFHCRAHNDASDPQLADGRLVPRYWDVGGTPSWAQYPEFYRCACGADLVYLCQVPEGMEFAVHPGLPEQPYSVGADTYGLFLGNENYLLACPAHCDPAAVWPVNQN
ncbi:hypothetical protein [Streptomyces sp. NPDC059575]|uniref:hypothetical protein n=1 Tax=Streptomyces sp. NPDC059575 TaxID=3346872 RepID=UPI0036948AD5